MASEIFLVNLVSCHMQIFSIANMSNLSLLKCISDIKAVCNDVTRQHKERKMMKWIMEEKKNKKNSFT
jgi:hypothetical protein